MYKEFEVIAPHYIRNVRKTFIFRFVQLILINGIEDVDSVWLIFFLAKPTFLENACYTKNTRVFFEWMPNDTEIDAYLLELYFSLDKPATKIYRGNETHTFFDVESYNKNVYVRLFSINISGVSESSDLISLKTSKGRIFCVFFTVKYC